MRGWKISHVLYFLAIIAALVGVILGVGVGIKNGSDLSENDTHNITRANLFFLASVAIGIIAMVQMSYDKHGHHRLVTA
ncbi:MAG: hypothetical protein COA94_08710 [Rickettsiales bacterium]|nr:MAG: hypothetical protein COA94_08710 [Rickettsiales bacterium]